MQIIDRGAVRLVRFAPGERQPLHHHNEARLIVFLGGDMLEETLFAKDQFVRGDVLFRPPSFGHSNTAGKSGAAYIRLPISPAAVRTWVEERGWHAWVGQLALDDSELRSLGEGIDGDALLTRLNRRAYHREDSHSDAFHEALHGLVDEGERIEELSRRLGCRPYAFSRRFSAEMGLSPRKYRSRARLQRALERLAHTSEPFAQVAASVGYYDQSHLARSVKRETGLTPSQFRARTSRRV